MQPLLYWQSGGFLMKNWLLQRVDLTPNRLAVRFNAQELTFKELNQRVQKLVRKLGAPLAAEQRVAIITPNNLDGYLLILAVQQLGKTIVFLNRRLSQRELAYQLQDAAIRVLIQDDDYELRFTGISQLTFSAIEALPEQAYHAVATFDLDDVATIMYTSGTTGNPKGVMQTFGNHFYSAIGSALNLGMLPGDVWIAAVPLFHISGFSIMTKSLIYGMGVSLYDHFDVDAINAELQNGQASTISVVPVMLKNMLAALPANTTYHPNFRTVLLGGGPTDMPTLERASKLGVAIVQSYGMTETASQVVALAGEDAVRKLGSVGKPLFPVEIRVKTTADAQTGRVQVKSPTLTVGYLNNEAKYQAAFDDGWFDTGDMGWFDEEGYLYIQGREGDMISSGGENVFPDEIESAYAALPEIETIAVAGVPDEKWGAVPVAYIKFVPGQSLTQATLRAFGRQQLAHFKVPAKFVTVTDFPRTASGKLQRHLLAEQSFEIIP